MRQPRAKLIELDMKMLVDSRVIIGIMTGLDADRRPGQCSCRKADHRRVEEMRVEDVDTASAEESGQAEQAAGIVRPLSAIKGQAFNPLAFHIRS